MKASRVKTKGSAFETLVKIALDVKNAYLCEVLRFPSQNDKRANQDQARNNQKNNNNKNAPFFACVNSREKESEEICKIVSKGKKSPRISLNHE